jgi:hypothetical protein
MSSERDTHFAGFAKLLLAELDNEVGSITSICIESDTEFNETEFTQKMVQIIARRAYDLITHALVADALRWPPLATITIEDIPDMTEWPKDTP